MNNSKICDFTMVIWSDEILELLKDADPKDKIVVYLGYPINRYFPITGAEDSQSAGWWEIRFDPDERIYNTITVETLLANLPKGFMVMLQEKVHIGKSYPITRAFRSRDGWTICCDDSNLEYWDELEKWKIEEDKKLKETKLIIKINDNNVNYGRKCIIHRNKWIWGRTWVIVAEGGAGLIKISQDQEDGVVLSGLSVFPDHRRKGIGTSLVREAERIVQEEIGEREDITLSVESWNKELIGWYTKLGFCVYDYDSDYTYLILVNY